MPDCQVLSSFYGRWWLQPPWAWTQSMSSCCSHARELTKLLVGAWAKICANLQLKRVLWFVLGKLSQERIVEYSFLLPVAFYTQGKTVCSFWNCSQHHDPGCWQEALPFRYLALGRPAVADMLVLVFAVPPGQGVRWECPCRQQSIKAVLI